VLAHLLHRRGIESVVIEARDREYVQQRGLIVIGYGGNDESVMGALEALPDDALEPGVWWVARTQPNARVCTWLSRQGGHWVESTDFDQLMLLIQREFNLPHPKIDRWATVRDRYFEALGQLLSEIDDLPRMDTRRVSGSSASAPWSLITGPSNRSRVGRLGRMRSAGSRGKEARCAPCGGGYGVRDR
jgi:hypothetical protein